MFNATTVTPSATTDAHHLAELMLRNPEVGLKAAAFASREVQEIAAFIVSNDERVDVLLNHDACPRVLKIAIKACLEDIGELVLS